MKKCDGCIYKYTKHDHDGDRWNSDQHCAKQDEKIRHIKKCKEAEYE